MTVPAEAGTARLRAMLAGRTGIREQRMFGGVCFMQDGHMLCGADRHGYLFRVGEAGEAALLALPGAERMAQGGRPMRGFVRLRPVDRSDAELARDLALADAFIATLPPKLPRRPRKETVA